MKRFLTSIKEKVQTVICVTAAVALFISAICGLVSMQRIRMSALNGEETLGDKATELSEEALISLAEQSTLDLINSKAQLAYSKLSRFSDFVSSFASYAESLYAEPSRYSDREVSPPDKANAGQLTMQRALANESVSADELSDEISLLGNMEDIFRPILEQYSSMISSVYIATTSGVVITFDTASDLTDKTDSDEEYYDYFNTGWYTGAIENDGMIFTDTYQDGYGRGLTISCSAPVKDSSGETKAVVCADILIADINSSIIDINLGDNSYALLIDSDGDIIASPNVDSNDSELQNIKTDKDNSAYEIADDILSGETGVKATSSGVYYAYTPITSAQSEAELVQNESGASFSKSWTLAVCMPKEDITSYASNIGVEISDISEDTTDEMNKAIISAIVFFVAMFVLIIAAMIPLSGKFAKKLTNPILKLKRDVSEISRGNLDHKTEVSAIDEIGELAKAFNLMSESLKSHIDELTAVTAEKERIGAELDIAANIQAHMLPCIFPAFPERSEFDIYASTTPAKEVGGDFYDYFLIDDDHLAVVIADVSGKGVPAALFMMISKTLLKSSAQLGLSPKATLEKVNNQLAENNDAEMFVTVWLGILEISTGKLICANAGHEFPAIMRAKTKKWEIFRDKHGFVLAGMENSRYSEYELKLEKGDMLFLYTDGVTEATNSENKLFGMDALLKTLNQSDAAECCDVIEQVTAGVNRFVGKASQFDDLTMLCLKLNPENEITVKPDDLNELARLTEFAESIMTKSEVPLGVITKMNIAIDEICSNIVRYSGAKEASLVCNAENGAVTITFTDNGTPYNPLEKKDPDITLSADERQIGGLGIFMVKNLADDISYKYENGKNVLKIEKRY